MALSKQSRLKLAMARKRQLELQQEQEVPQRQQELSSQIQRLEASGVDEGVTRVMKTKLKLLQESVTNEDLPFSLQDKPFETTGQNITEGMAKSGIPVISNPQLSAAVGTLFTMIPDLATSLPAFKGAKTGISAVKATGKAIKASKLGEAIRSTGAKEVERLAEKKIVEAGKGVLKSQKLKELGKEAGEAIGKAEKDLGIGFEDISSVDLKILEKGPEAIVKMADRFTLFIKMGAKRLAKEGSPQQLQRVRKTASEALKKGGVNLTESASLKFTEAKKIAIDAIGLRSKQFQSAMSRFKDVAKAIADLPASKAKQAVVLNRQLAAAKRLAAEQVRTRLWAGGTAALAAASLLGRKAVGLVTGD